MAINMSTAQEQLAAVMSRIDQENQDKSTTELILDSSNEVSFPGFPYTFRAIHSTIIVSIDIFKSGYECKGCLGKRRIKTFCFCESNGRSGFKYNEEQIEALKSSFGEIVAETRKDMVCPECSGDFENSRVDKECPDCEGRGALLVLPDSSKNMPTTGTIVSMGKIAKAELEKEDIHIGDRILFGPYAGNMIPTKIGLMFKYMDWNLGVIKIGGAEDMCAFDFILQAD